MSKILSSASLVGFSGSRHQPCLESERAIRKAVSSLSPQAQVHVGCAAGVDQLVRQLVPTARVFSAELVGFSGRGAFARRSQLCVESCLGGVWCSFPSSECPAGLAPSASAHKCFAGSGSGTWASLTYAVGIGITCLVFLPTSVSSPEWLGTGSRGWFLVQPTATQLSLFSEG